MGVQRSTARAFRRGRDRSPHGGRGAGIRPQRVLREKAARNGVLQSTTRENRPVDGRPGHRMRSVSLGASRRTEGEFFVNFVNIVGAGAIPSWFEVLLFPGNRFRAKKGGVEGRVRRSRSQSGRVRFPHPTRGQVDGASCETNTADAARETTRSRGEFCVIRVNYVVIGAFESRYGAVLSCGNGLKTKNTVVERRDRRPEDESRGAHEMHRSCFGLRRSGAERGGVRGRAVSACAARRRIHSVLVLARSASEGLGQGPSLALRASMNPARRREPWWDQSGVSTTRPLVFFTASWTRSPNYSGLPSSTARTGRWSEATAASRTVASSTRKRAEGW